MLTPEQVDHFQAFGFLLLPQLFDLDEIQLITAAADTIWAGEQARSGETALGMAPFIELSPQLDWLGVDDRIYGAMQSLLGGGLIWSGSEGNKGSDPPGNHDWHADRPGPRELDYLRIKIMLYLAPMAKEEGALRIIPGSHREPLHTRLKPFQDVHGQPHTTFFGQHGSDVPCVALETRPGDAALFSQSIFHGVYGKEPDRRYIALKYAARPTTDRHLASLCYFSPYAFEAHGSYAHHESPRIRGMVDGIVAQRDRATRVMPEYYPES